MEFVRDHGVAESAVEQICSPTHALSVAEVYGALGHEYVAIDVQQARGVNFFDLNCFVAPNEWREVFDLVNNEGVIEHLINPTNGFWSRTSCCVSAVLSFTAFRCPVTPGMG